jgi:uncharacterized protein YndB with AHSA1/START domain
MTTPPAPRPLGPPPTSAPPAVERSIEIDAEPAEVWDVLTDPDQLEGWLGERVELDLRPGGGGTVVDDDGTRREVLVTTVEVDRALAWHWWTDGDELSSVEITLAPAAPGHGTLVRVVETLTAPAGTPWMRACAGARLGSRLRGLVVTA